MATNITFEISEQSISFDFGQGLAAAADIAKLAGIEAGADVTDAANVAAAGALMAANDLADLAVVETARNNLGIVAVSIDIDGGGAPIAAGKTVYARVPYDITFTGWTMIADVSGSIVCDIWQSTFAAAPPTNADSITGGNEPTIAAAVSAQATTITGWTTTTLTEGNILAVHVDSAATITSINLQLHR